MQVMLSGLTAPRERTPKLTHFPWSKLPWSYAPEPESPSQVLASPETNSLGDSTFEVVGSLKQLGRKPVSFGMQTSPTFCFIRRTPAVAPLVSVGLLIPYPIAVTCVEYAASVIGGSIAGTTCLPSRPASLRGESAKSFPPHLGSFEPRGR